MQQHHRIDVLVNNAGLLAKAAVAEAAPDHFRRVMDVNFFGCIDLITAVSPIMIQQRSGTIVNVGSIASYTSQVGRSRLRQLSASASAVLHRQGTAQTGAAVQDTCCLRPRLGSARLPSVPLLSEED